MKAVFLSTQAIRARGARHHGENPTPSHLNQLHRAPVRVPREEDVGREREGGFVPRHPFASTGVVERVVRAEDAEALGRQRGEEVARHGDFPLGDSSFRHHPRVHRGDPAHAGRFPEAEVSQRDRLKVLAVAGERREKARNQIKERQVVIAGNRNHGAGNALNELAGAAKLPGSSSLCPVARDDNEVYTRPVLRDESLDEFQGGAGTAPEMQVGQVQEADHSYCMKKILVFVNPNARQGAASAEKVAEWAKSRGYQVLNGDQPGGGDCEKEIRRHGGAVDAVVIGGGDGTVNAALPALLETRAPLVLLPLGTANNLARTLEIPSAPDAAFALIEEGRLGEIDVGIANGIPFLNVIGLGLSTQVNRLTRSGTKRWFGVLAFIAMALKVALRMRPFRIRVECDGSVHHGRTWQVSVCNGRNYGSGLTIHEQATLRDQKLHGLSTEVAHWWHVFHLVPALLRGRFSPEQDVFCFSGRGIRIETSHHMRVDVDGDIKTVTPLEVSVRPRALRIYLPLARPAEIRKVQ